MTRPLAIGFAVSPTWLRGEHWRAPDSRVEELFALSPYADLARHAERVGVDFLFNADAGFLDPAVLDRAPGFSTLDSHTLLSALAAVTERIGLVPTVQSSFASPFTVARQLQSLHRLSDGRAGWNVVTALGGHENHGLASLPDSPERYARAAELVAAVHALWASYPADALLLDRERGRFADASRVRPAGVAGARFRAAGPLPVAAHPDGPPPLFQAGGSPSGVAFAGATADAVFGLAATVEEAAAQRAALRRAAVEAGRAADAVRFLPGFVFRLAAPGAPRADAAADTGGPAHWGVDGTPADAVAEILHRHEAGAIDGLIALAGGGWESMRLFFDEVMPALAAHGVLLADPAARTLRARLGLAVGPPAPDGAGGRAG